MKLAVAFGCKPYNIPRILYSIQSNLDTGMSYDVDKESFILKINSVPSQNQVTGLASAMLEATRKIESALV